MYKCSPYSSIPCYPYIHPCIHHILLSSILRGIQQNFANLNKIHPLCLLKIRIWSHTKKCRPTQIPKNHTQNFVAPTQGFMLLMNDIPECVASYMLLSLLKCLTASSLNIKTHLIILFLTIDQIYQYNYYFNFFISNWHRSVLQPNNFKYIKLWKNISDPK